MDDQKETRTDEEFGNEDELVDEGDAFETEDELGMDDEDDEPLDEGAPNLAVGHKAGPSTSLPANGDIDLANWLNDVRQPSGEDAEVDEPDEPESFSRAPFRFGAASNDEIVEEDDPDDDEPVDRPDDPMALPDQAQPPAANMSESVMELVERLPDATIATVLRVPPEEIGTFRQYPIDVLSIPTTPRKHLRQNEVRNVENILRLTIRQLLGLRGMWSRSAQIVMDATAEFMEFHLTLSSTVPAVAPQPFEGAWQTPSVADSGPLPGWPDTDAPMARPDFTQPEPPDRFLKAYGSRSLSDILGIALTMRPFENRPFVAPRAARSFAQRGINTLGQVLRMTPYQLLRVQGVGAGSIWAILTSMNRLIPFPNAQTEFTAQPARIETDFTDEGTSLNISAPRGFGGERVLVTGGLGFVGSNVVHALYAAGANVVVLDDGFTGTKQNIAGCSNVEVVAGSVTDPDVMRWVMQRIDTVFHLACRNISVSTKDPYADAQVNAMGTANVLLAARDCRVRRVVFTSSASIYGNARRLPAFEEDPADLLSPYAASKYAAEAFCSAYYESLGVPVTVLRLSNVYGPYQRPDNPYCGVVSKFMDAAIQGAPLVIFGDGEQTRDFTFVGDAVDAILQAALSPKAEGRLYNVATGNEVSVNHLAEMVMKTSGQVCRIENEAKRDIDSVRRRVLSADRIRRDLRWSARTSLSEGLQKTFEWLRRLQP